MLFRSRFATVANITGNTASSSDGITWTQGSNMPFSWYANSWQDMAFGNGHFVAIGWAYAGATSIDGVNWHRASLPYLKYWQGVAYGAPYFVATGSGYTSSYGYPYSNQAVAVTPDPHDWGSSVMDQSAVWTDVAYGNRTFVAITSNSALSSTSVSSGRSWTTANNMPVAQNWSAIIYGDKFVAVAQGSSTAAYSADGITWTATTLPSNQCWTDVAYGNGLYVAVSSNSDVAAKSTDGITWTARSTGLSSSITSITWNGSIFVAVGGSGKCVTSPDGRSEEHTSELQSH